MIESHDFFTYQIGRNKNLKQVEKGAHSDMLLVNLQIYAMSMKSMLVFYKCYNKVVKIWWL